MSGKKIIAVVDNDTEFIGKFKNTLKNLDLSNKYEPELFQINVEEDISKCIENLKKSKKSLAVIMIDIVIFEMGAPSRLLEVVKIFEEIRRELPNFPIFFITRHIKEEYLPLICWCSLEDIDGILIKQYLYLPEKDRPTSEEDRFHKYIPLTKNDIATIFREAKRKRDTYLTASILSIPKNIEEENYEIIKEVLHPDERSVLQINEIGCTIFIHLIDELFGEQTSRSGNVTISYFRPGFSGSYLFRIDVYMSGEEKTYLMKINNDEKIKREFDNYNKISGLLSSQNYPSIPTDYVTYGKWGAFCMELQKEMITLPDYLCERKLEEAHMAITNLEKALSQLYRNKYKQPLRLWKEHYQFSSKIYLQLLAFFEDKKTLLHNFMGEDEIKKLEKFVFTQGGDLSHIYEKIYPIYVGNIHGDLNARNVLVQPESHQIILIDYANMEETGHITRDIAKLEADLIFSVLHSNNNKFYDWNSIEIWKSLLDLLDLENIFDFNFKITTSDTEIEKVSKFIVSLRKSLKEDIYPNLGVGEYLNSLLYYSFHYLVYQDISIQKKVFGTKWLSQIITKLENASANT